MSTKPFHSGPLTAYYRHDQLLDKALEAVRRLPPSNQDEIAHAMLGLAGDRPTVRHCRALPGNPSIFEKCLSKNDGCAGQARA
jgi:hypothetical protein